MRRKISARIPAASEWESSRTPWSSSRLGSARAIFSSSLSSRARASNGSSRLNVALICYSMRASLSPELERVERRRKALPNFFGRLTGSTPRAPCTDPVRMDGTRSTRLCGSLDFGGSAVDSSPHKEGGDEGKQTAPGGIDRHPGRAVRRAQTRAAYSELLDAPVGGRRPAHRRRHPVRAVREGESPMTPTGAAVKDSRGLC